MGCCSIHESLNKANKIFKIYSIEFYFLTVVNLRHDIVGPQAEQLESVSCGQILHDKDSGWGKEEPGPAWMKDKETTCFSSLRPRRPPTLHVCRKVSQGSEKGAGVAL